MIENTSYLISKTIGFSVPFVIIAAIYITVNGHISPGGGFQGGALLACVMISRYLYNPVNDIRMKKIQYTEKLLLFFIILLFVSFLATGINSLELVPIPLYMVSMNILIGLKVACGLSIIFYQFIFYEDR
ncbi:MAG: sodium:proton antiporter [Clostridia bacterium]|nr:sodium:proton antiporter [Clostridia bacterium]